MGEPGGLPSLGSHRVGHDWSDLAAAAGQEYGTQKGLAEYIPGDQSQEIRKEGPRATHFILVFHVGNMRNCMTSKAAGPADSASPRTLFSSVCACAALPAHGVGKAFLRSMSLSTSLFSD